MPNKEPAAGQPSGAAEKRSGVNPLFELQEAYRQADLNWAREVQLAIADSQAECQKVQAEFAQNLQEQWRSAKDMNQYVENYRGQLKQFQERAGGNDLNKRLVEAHRNYFRAIRDAWSRLDPDSISFG